MLLREQVSEIFWNSYITCYKELSSKYVSLKKFCGADKRKNLLFHYCFLIFFHLQNFQQFDIDTHLIDLSCHQILKKITDRKRKHGSWKYGNWKYGKSHGRLDPTLRMRVKLFTCSIGAKPVNRCKTTAVPSGRILCEKRGIFSFDLFTGYKKSNQNQLGRVLPFAFPSRVIRSI